MTDSVWKEARKAIRPQLNWLASRSKIKEKKMKANTLKKNPKLEKEYKDWENDYKKRFSNLAIPLTPKQIKIVRNNKIKFRKDLIKRIEKIKFEIECNEDNRYRRNTMVLMIILNHEIRQYIEAIHSSLKPCEFKPNKKFFNRKQFIFNFKELYKCGEGLELNSEKLEKYIVKEIFQISYYLKKELIPIAFLKSKGYDTKKAFSLKNYLRSLQGKTLKEETMGTLQKLKKHLNITKRYLLKEIKTMEIKKIGKGQTYWITLNNGENFKINEEEFLYIQSNNPSIRYKITHVL